MSPGPTQHLSISSREDAISDSSDSGDDCNNTIGSISLRDELRSVSEVLANLKRTCPERSNPGRQKKSEPISNKTANDLIPKIIEYLDTIHNLNTRIIDKIDEISTENCNLRAELEAPSRNSYANVASTAIPSAATGSHPESGNKQGKTENSASLPPELQKISSRVDQLEQDTLSNVLMLQGSTLDSIFSAHDRDTSAAAESSAETRDQQPQPSQAALKKSVCDILRPTVPHITDDWITHVSIQGRDRKHLKLVCISNEEKTRLVSSLKRAKPLNLYANDYLTKIRASLLFRARTLKRRYPNTLGVFCKNGIVYCKTDSTAKPFSLNDISDLNKLEERLITSTS